jgi:hypothetical protein
MEAVDQRLAAQRADAKRTLEMLASARRAAEAADHAEANELKKQGILVSAHLPVGPSHLTRALDAAQRAKDGSDARRAEVRAFEKRLALVAAKPQKGGGGGASVADAEASWEAEHAAVEYPSLVPELISARALMEANWQDYLFRSGNLKKPPPPPKGRLSRAGSDDDDDDDDDDGAGSGGAASPEAAAGQVDDGLGYLKLTGSLAVRKSLLLSTSHGPRGAKYKPAPTKGPEAAMDSLLRAAIDADMATSATVTAGSAGGTGLQHAGAPPKKKKEAHGEQHDLDLKVMFRMEKKLQFTGNPRHDPRNKNHHRLLTLAPAGPAPDGVATLRAATGLLGPTGIPGDGNPLGGTAGVLQQWGRRTKAPPPGDHGFLVASPDVVEFTAYAVAGRYEAAVRVANVTAVARSLAILPLATQFFSVASVVYPSAWAGSLAPGMAVTITVRFEPDSLADYEDFLTVHIY